MRVRERERKRGGERETVKRDLESKTEEERERHTYVCIFHRERG